MTVKVKEFLEQAAKIGCYPEVVSDQWVRWDKPLPSHMLIDAMDLANDILNEIRVKDD